MSNFNDDYKDVKAKITFNKIKKRRKGKIRKRTEGSE